MSHVTSPSGRGRLPAALLGVALVGLLPGAPARALPREMVRDFPNKYCPVHSGKSVSEDGVVVPDSPVRIRQELVFQALGTQAVIAFSTCSAGQVLTPGLDLGIDNFAVVRSNHYLANQVDRSTVPGGGFGDFDCYQEEDQQGLANNVGTVFNPNLKPLCGPGNPSCPFGDDFEDPSASAAHWTVSATVGFVLFDDDPPTIELRLADPDHPDVCATASVTVGPLVPGTTYVVDYDWRASNYSRGERLITADVPFKPRADLDGDGQTDILWRNQTTGTLAAWLLDGTVLQSGLLLNPSQEADTNWRVEGVGDFNDDGKTDLVWRNQADGRFRAWFMNGTTRTGVVDFSPGQIPDTNWRIEGVADLNGDGQHDLLWRHQTLGYMFALFLDGTTATGFAFLTPSQIADTNWHIEGVDDFDGDGKPDLLLRHQTQGYLVALFLDGTVATGFAFLTPNQIADVSWKIEQVADFDADGKPDLLFRNQATGVLVVLFMDGVVASGFSFLTPSQVSDTSWRIESH